jgi:excisionase family DNA binding protein
MDATYTTKEAAAILEIGQHTVIHHIRRGNLPATKHGRDWSITKHDLDAFIQQRRTPGRPPTHKVCSRCHIEKPMDAYASKSTEKWGKQNACRACQSLHYQEQRANGTWRDAEHLRIYKRTYYAAHKEYYSKKHREWIAKNRDTWNAWRRAWGRTPIGNASNRQRLLSRRARLKTTQNDLTRAQIQDLMQRQRHCAYCKKKFSATLPATIDHVIPLSKNGPHTLSNIVLSCQPCNSSKGNQLRYLL